MDCKSTISYPWILENSLSLCRQGGEGGGKARRWFNITLTISFLFAGDSYLEGFHLDSLLKHESGLPIYAYTICDVNANARVKKSWTISQFDRWIAKILLDYNNNSHTASWACQNLKPLQKSKADRQHPEVTNFVAVCKGFANLANHISF